MGGSTQLGSISQNQFNFSEEPPALPKKIRSCCLYKYPDWVQGMVGEGKAPVSGGSQHQHPPSQHSHWHPPGGSGPSTTTTSGRPPLPLSMREAQYHLQVGQQGNTTATPSQLDPGSLLDSSRRGSRGPARGTGANSLLKQAIANRLKEEEKKDDETKMDRGEAEMSRSIVGNPAWYRDDEGRTGFKPREWENLPNQQKEQVKKRREKKKEETGTAVAEIDKELLKEKEPVEEERELTKEEKKVLKKKEKEEKKEEEKRKKEEKRREKEEKKRLEKEEKERKKSQTSSDKVEREKPETGLQEGTLEKEKRRSKSKERESDAVSREKKEKMRREKENSTERTEGTGDDKLRDKKERRQEKGESHRTREHLGPERESSMGRDSTDHLNREPKESRGERHKRMGHPDQGSESTDKREKSRDREQRRYSDTKGETHQIREHSDREESHKTREPSKRDRETRHSTSGHRTGRESRDQSSPPEGFDSHQKEPTAKIDNPTLRRDSNTSAASSTKSTDTVRHHPVSGKPPRHPSIESSKTPVQSSPSSSNEEDRRAMILAKPRRTNIGERRDSSMSESSRISAVSHKSVTFSDRVQTHEIERIVLSSSEDDVGVMSDDELSKPDSERRRKLVRMLQEQEEATDSEEEDDFEEQERFIEQRMLEEQMMSPGIYPVYNLNETSSQNSMYPEELDPDRYLLEEDGSYISLDKLPAAVRRAIIADMTSRPRDDEINMGSMSKLHEEGPYSPGLVRSHEGTLPRSASGYLDEQYMIQSYQQAMYGAFHPDDRVRSPGDQPSSTLSPPQGRVPRTMGERRQLHQLHESFYDNVPSRTSSLIGVPVETRESRPVMPQRIQERRGSEALERAEGGELVTPVPSPPRRGSSTSIERRAFFESMNPSIGGVHAKRDDDSTPTPSPPRLIVSQPAAGQPQQRLRVTTTTTSTMQTNRTEILEKESRNEDDMRRRFVKQFGANRKAPRAEEEDPLDPGPTSGSRESIYSTDSRESVVSEASIRKENFVRRNFNY